MTSVVTRTHTPGLQDRILRRVAEKPGESYRDIASYLEADRSSVNKALWRLVERGDILKTDGQYFVRDYDYMDDLVASANRLSRAVPSLAAQYKRPAWWRLRVMNLPVWFYPLAALLSYGAGRWH